ncbi:MAG: SDR family NAD(P)-dependent oxidoreductase [Rubrobacteraceae bacterium]
MNKGNGLTGSVAVVTGGSRGLGRAICLTLAEGGATVAVNYASSAGPAQRTVEMIESEGGEAIAVQADVTDEASVETLVRETSDRCGATVDILVNSATGPQPVVSIEESTWQTFIDQLLFAVKAPLLLTKAVVPAMKEKGYGKIINIGSEVVQTGEANYSSYVTAKSAMIGMTRSWATELGPYGITVNLVAPGFTPTERHEDVEEAVLEDYTQEVPLRRMGEPADIGRAVSFLASADGGFITGQTLAVNGGHTFGV